MYVPSHAPGSSRLVDKKNVCAPLLDWKSIMPLNSLFFILIFGIWGSILIPSSYKLILRQYSLFTTTLVFFLSLFLRLGFDQSTSKFQFITASFPTSTIHNYCTCPLVYTSSGCGNQRGTLFGPRGHLKRQHRYSS